MLGNPLNVLVPLLVVLISTLVDPAVLKDDDNPVIGDVVTVPDDPPADPELPLVLGRIDIADVVVPPERAPELVEV